MLLPLLIITSNLYALAPTSQLDSAIFQCRWVERAYPHAELKGEQAAKERRFGEIAKRSNTIVCVCSYCKTFLHTKDPQGAPAGLSHGICNVCVEKQHQELKEWKEARRKASDLCDLFDNMDPWGRDRRGA